MDTQTHIPGDLLVGDYPVAVRTVTIASGQSYLRGTVLGRITASDKYTASLSAAADGSEDPIAVLAVNVDATAGDVQTRIYTSAEFDASRMIVGAGHTAATVEAAFRNAGSSLYVRQLA